MVSEEAVRSRYFLTEILEVVNEAHSVVVVNVNYFTTFTDVSAA